MKRLTKEEHEDINVHGNVKKDLINALRIKNQLILDLKCQLELHKLVELEYQAKKYRMATLTMADLLTEIAKRNDLHSMGYPWSKK